jgi:replication initiation protein RepC
LVTWTSVIEAAHWLSGEMQISRSLWDEACNVLGYERAAITLAIVSAKDRGHFTKSAAAYFGGIIKKAQREGQINLAGSIWALHNQVLEARKTMH